MSKQYITKKGSFDSGHRIMHERLKCFNMHGHTFLYELTFLFTQTAQIGYAIDFKEIKRIAVAWIEDFLDHGMILNPLDKEVIKAVHATGTKMWLMSLNGENQYCNPSVENIAKELFLAMQLLFIEWPYLEVRQIRLYETRSCYTDCFVDSITEGERQNFLSFRKNGLLQFAQEKGKVEYDERS